MNQILAVHFQYMKDNGELAKRLFDSGKPFIASIVPNLFDKTMKTEEGEPIYDRIHLPENYYPDWAIDIFKANANNPNVTWVQEGYRHCCGRCFNERERNKKDGKGDFPDPHHEHVCLDGVSQDSGKQLEVISKGKILLEDFKIIPQGYCSPNHLDSEDTTDVIKYLDFDYLLIRNGYDYLTPNTISFSAYRDYNGIIILPETKIEIPNTSPVLMTYYDHICEGKVLDWEQVLSSSESLDRIEFEEISKIKVWENRELVKSYKKTRDLAFRFK